MVKAICDVCKTAVEIPSNPIGIALMPELWFVSVRKVADEIQTIDVCSEECATNYDKQFGRPDGKKQTDLHDLIEGELVKKTVVHEEVTNG